MNNVISEVGTVDARRGADGLLEILSSEGCSTSSATHHLFVRAHPNRVASRKQMSSGQPEDRAQRLDAVLVARELHPAQG